RIEFHDGVCAFVDHPQVVVLVEADGVRITQPVNAFADFTKKLAVRIELPQLCGCVSVQRTRTGGSGMIQDDDVSLGIDGDAEDLAEILIRTDLEKIRIRFERNRRYVVEDRHILIWRLQWRRSGRRGFSLRKHRGARHSENRNQHTKSEPNHPAFHNKPPGAFYSVKNASATFRTECYSLSSLLCRLYQSINKVVSFRTAVPGHIVISCRC